MITSELDGSPESADNVIDEAERLYVESEKYARLGAQFESLAYQLDKSNLPEADEWSQVLYDLSEEAYSEAGRALAESKVAAQEVITYLDGVVDAVENGEIQPKEESKIGDLYVRADSILGSDDQEGSQEPSKART